MNEIHQEMVQSIVSEISERQKLPTLEYPEIIHVSPELMSTRLKQKQHQQQYIDYIRYKGPIKITFENQDHSTFDLRLLPGSSCIWSSYLDFCSLRWFPVVISNHSKPYCMCTLCTPSTTQLYCEKKFPFHHIDPKEAWDLWKINLKKFTPPNYPDCHRV